MHRETHPPLKVAAKGAACGEKHERRGAGLRPSTVTKLRTKGERDRGLVASLLQSEAARGCCGSKASKREARTKTKNKTKKGANNQGHGRRRWNEKQRRCPSAWEGQGAKVRSDAQARGT